MVPSQLQQAPSAEFDSKRICIPYLEQVLVITFTITYASRCLWVQRHRSRRRLAHAKQRRLMGYESPGERRELEIYTSYHSAAFLVFSHVSLYWCYGLTREVGAEVLYAAVGIGMENIMLSCFGRNLELLSAFL